MQFLREDHEVGGNPTEGNAGNGDRRKVSEVVC
jgi:hypothetical protein